ncbi:MAG: nitroreductase, partial [Oscillospiraceae bacterium]|nr:nitroreductase [Oscillospiraceae bacterium]
MDIQEAIRTRHSVRSYMDKPLPTEAVEELEREITACNAESGLHIQLVTDEAEAFGGLMAHYGKFSCVKNYIALVGPEGPGLEEK